MPNCPPTRPAMPTPMSGAIQSPTLNPMRRGEIWWVSFVGSSGEIKKTRPAVIVSNGREEQLLDEQDCIEFELGRQT
jgi:hypothetical protein